MKVIFYTATRTTSEDVWAVFKQSPWLLWHASIKRRPRAPSGGHPVAEVQTAGMTFDCGDGCTEEGSGAEGDLRV